MVVYIVEKRGETSLSVVLFLMEGGRQRRPSVSEPLFPTALLPGLLHVISLVFNHRPVRGEGKGAA